MILTITSDNTRNSRELYFEKNNYKYFFIYSYKPTPFFIMDEGDAALDNVNINKLIRFIRSKTNNMQIIVITLNKRLASRADMLIGVTTQVS